MDNKDKESIQRVLFIDLDILNTEKSTEEKSHKTIDYIREFCKDRWGFSRNSDKDETLSMLSDDEVITMYNWSNDRINDVQDIRRNIDNTRLVFMTSDSLNHEHYCYMFEFRYIHDSDLLVYERGQLPGSIRKYLSEHTEFERYAIASRIDLRTDFPEHAVWIRTERPNFDAIKSRVHRFLYYDAKDYFSWHIGYMKRDEDPVLPFYKVIFLDIDGVLNDEGDEYKKGVKIDQNMVKRLGRIVEATDADVVLSSSWKRAYKRFVDNGFTSKKNDESLKLLYESLKAVGITIRGVTPLSMESGARARPFEIREWLMKCHSIFSYVILEDDTFWSWGFLQRNVVSTVRIDPTRDEYHQIVKGLTDEHVEKAIAILNERSALPYKFWDEV